MSVTVGEKRGVPEEFLKPVIQKKFLVDGSRVGWHADRITAVKKSLDLKNKKWTADAQKLLDWLCEDSTRSIKNAHRALNIAKVESERPRKDWGEAGTAPEASAAAPPASPTCAGRVAAATLASSFALRAASAAAALSFRAFSLSAWT